MDNLLAAGKAKPMVVVTPNGSVSLPGVSMGQSRGTAADGRPDMSQALSKLHDAFGEDLLKNVIPYVEKHCRALTDQPNRALAGPSMGGAETLRNGPPNMDKEIRPEPTSSSSCSGSASARAIRLSGPDPSVSRIC